MKVVCIDAYTFTGLTYHKVYDQVNLSDLDDINDRFITIIDNNGLKRRYLKDSFISLEEWRENKLKEILS